MINVLLALAAFTGAQSPSAGTGLGALDFLLYHCWRGELGTGEIDTHCFEPLHDGRHVRDRHEVTGGKSAYGGETLYSASADGGLVFHYFNSLGGVSQGVFRPRDDGLLVAEERYRGSGGEEISMMVSWRAMSEDSYEMATHSEDRPALNSTVVYRRVAAPVLVSESRAPDGTLTLVHETILEAPVAEVWTAVATAEGWTGWAVPAAWSPEPDIIETSYDPSAQPGGEMNIRQKILAQVAGRMIAFRTIQAPKGFPNFDLFSRTTGLFEFEPVGDRRTRIRSVGAGYPDSEAGRQLIGFFRDGNRIALERLQRRFTEGPVDWEAVRRGEGD